MNIHLRLMLTALLAGGLATCLGSPAQAQVRTSLSVAPGLAVGSSETGVAVSSAVAFDVGERTTVEGTVMTPLTGMRGFGMMGGLGQPLGTTLGLGYRF